MSRKSEATKREYRKTRAIVFGNYARMDMLVEGGKCPGCAAGWERNHSRMHLIPAALDDLKIQAIPCVQDWLADGWVAP